jgi:hypothetical protein
LRLIAGGLERALELELHFDLVCDVGLVLYERRFFDRP